MIFYVHGSIAPFHQRRRLARGGELPSAAHGLRKSRTIKLAEHGFTTLQLRSWVGHEDMKSLEVYIREANKKKVLQVSRVVV